MTPSASEQELGGSCMSAPVTMTVPHVYAVGTGAHGPQRVELRYEKITFPGYSCGSVPGDHAPGQYPGALPTNYSANKPGWSGIGTDNAQHDDGASARKPVPIDPPRMEMPRLAPVVPPAPRVPVIIP